LAAETPRSQAIPSGSLASVAAFARRFERIRCIPNQARPTNRARQLTEKKTRLGLHLLIACIDFEGIVTSLVPLAAASLDTGMRFGTSTATLEMAAHLDA